MADVKVSALAAPTGGASTSDLLYIVDVSDTTDGASGSGRKCAINDLPVPAAVTALINASVSASLLTCGIPIGIPSSGSMGANGALSGIATFPTTFNNPGVFLYFPVGAVYSGSSAGFYWTVMSSGSAGTVYNNKLDPAAPAIPGSPTAVSAAGPGVYTQTTVEVTALTATVAAASVDANSSIRMTEAIVAPTNSNTKTVRHRLNNTIIWYRNAVTNNFEGHEFVMVNRGLANQVTTKSDVSIVNVSNTVTGQYTAIDMTSDRTYAVTLQIGTATDFIVLDYVKGDIIK